MDKKKEIWKDIVGYENLYQVSNFGRVKSLARIVSNGAGKRNIEERILKQRKWNKFYFQIKLSKNGKVKTHYVHKLVAVAFLENACNFPVVNHIDGNGLNNFVENLEWCTQKYNVNHAWKNKLCEGVRESAKKSKGRAPQKVVRLDLAGNVIETYSSIKDVAKTLNITEAQARNSIFRQSKKFNLRWESDYYANN